MRVAILLATLLTTSASAVAGAISIISPDRAQTFAYGEMIWHQLYLERTGGELAARITFSNLLYVSGDGPRRDEPFDFRFPDFIYVYPYTNHFRVRAHYRHLGFATLKR